MMSQPGKRTNAIHILPNMSRSKGNQTMKVGQLIENDTENMFLEKSYTKCGGKTSPIFFSKISKLIISLNQWSKVLCSLFSLNVQVEGRPLAFTSYKAFLKSKKRSGTGPCLIFCIMFEEKQLSCYVLLIDQISLFGCLYLVRN